jgi:uncharacterized membrane protein
MINRKVPISAALTFGWETFKNNALFLIGLTVAVYVIGFYIGFAGENERVDFKYFQFVVDVIGWLVEIVLSMGLIAISLKFVDGVHAEFSDLFRSAPLVFHYVAASILYGLMVAFGLCLLIVPGIYLAIRFGFFSYFIVDEGAGPLDALQKSSQLTEGVKMDLFLLALTVAGLNVLGLLLFAVGLVVSVPVTCLMGAYVFRKLVPEPPETETQIAQAA